MRKWYIAVLVIIILAASLALTASASTGTVQRTLNYSDIKITLDGQEITPCDVNGNYIEPFIIDGTTYLPVRGIASALGLDVGWDQTTKTVQLSTGSAPAKATPQPDSRTISVEFLDLYKVESVDGVLYLKLQVTNLLSNQAVTITLTNMAVNGETVPLVSTAVPVTIRPGMSANGPFIIPTTALSTVHAAEVQDLIFDIEARDPDSFDVVDTISDFQVVIP